MHKGVIMLVEASDKDDAIVKVEEFLEHFGDGNVWDWYRIGGRWSNTLVPKKQYDKFYKKYKEIIKPELERNKGFGASTAFIEEHIDEIVKAWEDAGLEDKPVHYYEGGFAFSLPKTGGYYDVIPLQVCVHTVKKWCRDLEKVSDELFQEVLKERNKEKENPEKYKFSAYRAEQYSKAVNGYFSFDTNVFNVTTQEAEKIPKNIEGYWAVMIDMHN